MKKPLLSLIVLCSTLASAYAQDMGRGRGGYPGPVRGDRELRECLMDNDLLKRDNRLLTDRLLNCRDDRGSRERIDQLSRENVDLISRNQFLIDQVERLKVDNARLEIEAHPDRGGRFDLGSSIRACGKITTAIYAQQCAQEAKNNSIQADVIEACSRIDQGFYSLNCVKSIGANQISARQVEACTGITTSIYAQQCVQVAAEKRISSDVIRSCIQSSNQDFYRLNCVKSM